MKIDLINIRQKLLLFLFGIFAGVILIEIALRLLGAAYSIHDTLKNKAILTGNIDQRPVRILCLGACYTVGVGVPSEETYPSYLGQILRQNYPGKPFVIINKSVRAKSLSFFVNNLDKMIHKFNPQIVILDVNGMTDLDAASLLSLNKQSHGFWSGAKIRLDNFLNVFKIYKITKLAFFPGDYAQDSAETLDELLSAGDEDVYALKIKCLQDEAGKNPQDDEVLKKLAFAYAKRGLFDNTIETLEKAAEIGKNSFDLYCKMFKFLIIAGQYREAIELQKKLATAYPREMDALCHKINIGVVAGNIFPGSVDAVLLSQQYALIGRYEDARKIAEETRKRSKKKEVFKISYGNKQMERSNKYLPYLLEFYRAAQKLTDDPAAADVLTGAFPTGRPREFSGMKIDSFNSVDFAGADYKAKEKRSAPEKAGAKEAADRLLRDELAQVRRISQEHGVAILMENMGSYISQQESIKNICGEMGLPLADVFGYFCRAADRKRFFFPYPVYKRLNPEGNRQMAQLIYNALIEYEILSRPEN